jgi:hypothetical protein
MTIIKRTCANCAAFNPAPAGDDPACWNLVSFTEQHDTPHALLREPGPHDHCADHLTGEESADQTAFIDTQRDTDGHEGALQAAQAVSTAHAAIHQAQR